MPTKINIVGKTFNYLTVLSEDKQRTKDGKITYTCECKCGTVKSIRGLAIRQGKTQSCGCKHKEIITKHGMRDTPEYESWRRMIYRCTKTFNKNYKNYGARGIKICNRWRNSFENFYADMGKKPTKNHSLERVNNDGNYEPSNCIWGTKFQQSNNKRDNRNFTYKRKTQTIAQWAREYNIKYVTLYARLTRYKWTINKALEYDRRK